MAFDFNSMPRNAVRGGNANVLDLAAQGVVNWMATGKAVESPDLRWTWGKENEPSSMFRDYRFAGGLIGVGVHLLAPQNMVGRAGYDLAAGSLHSLIATERVRKASIDRLTAAAGQGGGAVPQIQNPTQPGAGAGGGQAQGVFARFRSFNAPGSFA